MKTVLVTGGSGFVGSALIPHLSRRYHVRCLVRPTSNQIAHSNVEYLNIDFAQPVLKPSSFQDVFAVIHLLSVKSAHDPEIWDINVNFTSSLISFASKQGVKRFLYISSESAQLKGIDLYSLSKKQAEREVRKHKGHLILRPTVIYGRGDISNIALVLNSAKYFRIVPVIGNGHQLFQPIHVSDVVGCIIGGLERNIEGTHLIAGKNAISFRDLIRIIADLRSEKLIAVSIPGPLAFLIARVLRFLKSPMLQESQVENLKSHRSYSMSEKEELFGVRFKSVREGLQESL